MITVIGVRFKTGGRVYYFDPGKLEIQRGDSVIVETARGVEFAEVTEEPHEVEDNAVIQPLKTVLRIATQEDRRKREENAAKEAEAFAIGEKKIKAHGLEMKLVSVEYAFDSSKVVFYFTADERVDFRELVRDLASQFRTRIELRQIGVRDEAKMLGGLGPCGRPVCCKTFLDDFRPVSIKMAKEQNLSLSPTKISGLCGRLMCCLQYEQGAYEDAKKRMPKVGKEMQGPDGIGIVVENNALTERTKLRISMQDGAIEVREYPYELLVKPGDPIPEHVGDSAENGRTEGQVVSRVEANKERTNGQRRQRSERPEPKRKREPKKTLEEHVAEVEATEDERSNTESPEKTEQKKKHRRRRSGKGRNSENTNNTAENNTVNHAKTRENNAEKKDGSVESAKKRRRPRRRKNDRPGTDKAEKPSGTPQSGGANNAD